MDANTPKKALPDQYIQTLLNVATPDDIFAARRTVYRQFAASLSEEAGAQCIASSIRVHNKYADILGFVECYSNTGAWTVAAKDTMYCKGAESIAWCTMRSGATEYAGDVRNRADYVRILDEGLSVMQRRFSVRGKPAGVIAVDWKVLWGAKDGFQEYFEGRITELESVLNKIADYEELFFSRLHSIESYDALKGPLSAVFGAAEVVIRIDRSREQSSELARPVTIPFVENPELIEMAGATTPASESADTSQEDKRRTDKKPIRVLRSPDRRSLDASVVVQDTMVVFFRLGSKQLDQNGGVEFTHEDETLFWEIVVTVYDALIKKDSEQELALRRLVEHRQGSIASLGALIAKEFAEVAGIDGVYIWAGVVNQKPSLAGSAKTFDLLMKLSPTYVFPRERLYTKTLWTDLPDKHVGIRQALTEFFRPAETNTVEAIAGVPLLFQSSDCEGFLWICGQTANFPTETDIEKRANWAAAAIEPTLLLEAKVLILEQVAAMTKQFAATTDVTDLAEGMLEICKKASGMDSGVIRRLEESATHWVRLAPKSPDAEETLPERLPENLILGVCHASKEMLYIRDTRGDLRLEAEWLPLPDGPRKTYLQKVRSVLVMPLQFGGHYIGVVVLQAFEPTALTPDRLGFLRMVAESGSLALRSALRFKDEHDRTEPFAIIGQMLTGFNHHIRTSVNALGLVISRLRTESNGTPSRPLDIADQELSRIKEVIQKINQLAQGRGTAELVNASALLDQCLASATNDLKDQMHNITLNRQYQAGVQLRVNSVQVEVAVTMLILNSIEAMCGKAGTLTLSLTRSSHQSRIRIADTGKGMERGQKLKLLEPFKSTKRAGSGLGLPIALHLIRRNGGSLRVTSIAGRGTIVTAHFTNEEKRNA